MKKNDLSLGVSLGAIALSLGLGIAVGRTISQHTAATQPGSAPQTQKQAATAAPTTGPKRYQVPVSDSQPSQGPKDALVTIVKWCDLPDSGCAAMEATLRELLAKDAAFVRVVFRHYAQLDSESSLRAHAFARAAFEQGGKFWEAQDLLFAHEGDVTMADVERYTHQLGLDWRSVKAAVESATFAPAISADRVFAGMFDVQQSASLFVNGRPLADKPTAQGLRALVEDELRIAADLMSKGVEKADLYAELTKHGAWNKPVLPPPAAN